MGGAAVVVFRLRHLHPVAEVARAFRARRCLAMVGLALAVHRKGLDHDGFGD